MIYSRKQLKTLDSFKLYRSPVHEESLFKGIDIQYLKLFKKSLEENLDTDHEEVSIIYRTTVL